MNKNSKKYVETFDELVKLADYSFMNNLVCDPDAKYSNDNKTPR